MNAFETNILGYFFDFGKTRENFVSLIEHGFLNFIRFSNLFSSSETAFDHFFNFFKNGMILVLFEERKEGDIQKDLDIINTELNIKSNCFFYLFIYLFI
jgi:hypothetical protein